MPEKSLDVLVRILTEHVGEQKASEILDQYKKSAGEALKRVLFKNHATPGTRFYHPAPLPVKNYG